MINVRRLGHATLTSPDLDRQVAYYTEIVGLSPIEAVSRRLCAVTRLPGEVRRIEVIFPGDPDQGEQRITSGIRERRPHPARRSHL